MADQQTNQSGTVPNTLPDNSQFRYETIDELWDTGNSGEILSQDYINMFSDHANKINQFAIPAYANLNTPNPGLATNTYDPYAQQNAPDLSTAEGKLRAISEPVDVSAIDKPIIKNPLYLGIRQSNFERYYKHPSFGKLGWTPFADMESYYNANSTWWDDASRMFGQFTGLAGTGFISAYRSIGDMFQGDPLGPDLKSAREFSDAMAIGNSTRGGVGGFTNNLLLQSAYTFGIIGSVAVEELALWGASALTAGAASPIAAGRTGVNAARVGRSIMNTFSVGRLANATRNMLRTFNQADQARDLYNIGKGLAKGAGNLVLPETMAALKTLNTTKNAAQNITNLSKVSKTFGGFYRDLRSMNYALAEGKMEAGMVYDQQLADGYGIMLAKNKGEPLTEEQIRNIEDKAARAAFNTTVLNAPVIYLTNQLTLGNAFGAYNRSLARMLGDNIQGAGRRIIKTKGLRDAAGKIVTRPYEYVGDGIKGYLKKMKAAGARGSVKSGLQASLRYFSANLGEGLQETYQEAVAEGTKEYYSALLEDPMAGGYDLLSSSVGSATSSQFTAQGFETFMSGFLMGGIVQGPQKLFFQGLPNLYNRTVNKEDYIKHKENKKKYIDSLVETYNDVYEVTATNPMASIFDPNKFDLIIQKVMSGDKLQAAFDQSQFDFADAGDFAKFQAIAKVIANDRAFEFRQQFQDILNLTDEELAEAFPSFKSDIRSGKIRERAQSMINKIDELEEAYYENKDTFVNPFDPSIYTYGTREWNDEQLKYLSFEHARYLYMFTKDGFNRALERADSIYNELSADPLISDMAASDITVLLSPESLDKEMITLATEITALDPVENKDIYDQKIAKLDGLKAIQEVLYNKENQKKDGSFDRRKINKLLPVFENYLKKLANSKKGFVEKDKVTEALKKIVDYSALKGRARAYDKTIEYLNNPARFDEITQRTYDNFKNIYNNRVQVFRKAVEKYIEKNEINTFLNALAELDVYPDFEQVNEFMETGNIEVLQDFFTEAGIVNPLSDSELFDKIEKIKSIYRATTTEALVEETKPEAPVNKKQEEFEEDLEITGPPVVLEGSTKEQHPFIKDLLNRKYDEYSASQVAQGKKPLGVKNWMRETEAVNLKSAYIALKKLWHSTLTETNEEALKTKYEGDVGFKEWLSKNKNEMKVTKVLRAANVSINDFLLEKPKLKDDPASDLEESQRVIDNTYNSVVIVEEKGLAPNEETGDLEPYTFYKILDSNNNEVSDEVVAAIKATPGLVFNNINEAKKTAKALDQLMVSSEPFMFGGMVLAHGTNVYDTSGTRYIVISDPKSIEKNKKIALLPVSEIKQGDTVADRYRAANKVDELTFKQSYTLDRFDYEKVSNNTSKLTITDPVKIHAHKSYEESPEEAETRLRVILETLTPQERAGLSVIVKRNQDPGKVIKELKLGDKEVNPFVEQIREPFSVGLVITDPEVRKKVDNALKQKDIAQSDSPDGVFAYIPTGAFQVLDINKKPVDLTNITEGAFENAFITYRNQTNPIKTLQDNATIQRVFAQKLNEKLGENSIGTFPVSEFQGFYLNLTSSLDRFGQAGVFNTMNELDYNTVDGVKVLYVNTRLSNGEMSSTIITDIEDSFEEDAFIEKLASEIPSYILEQVKSAQRYVGVVKSPNGVYTAIPLKSDLLPKQLVNQINADLVEQALETIDKNLKGKGEIEDKKISNPQYNTLFNKDINDRFYITTNLNGYDVEVNVNADGSFTIQVYSKKEGSVISKVNTFRAETTSLKSDHDLLNNLINRLNNKLEKQQAQFEEKRKKNPSLGRPDWLKLKIENIRYNFGQNISLEEVFSEAKSNIGENVRSNQRLLLGASSAVKQTVIPVSEIFTPTGSYTDAEGAPTKKGEEVKVSTESLETSETAYDSILDMSDEVFEEFAKNDFQDLDIAIKKQIANKIALKQELSDRERRVVENNVSGPIINVLATQVQSSNKIDDATSIQDRINEKVVELRAKKKEIYNNTKGTNKEKLLAAEKNPEVKALQKEIDDLRNQAIANKILAPGFTKEEVDNIDEFIEWANQNLPEFIDIEDLSTLRDNLLTNGVRVGAFGLSLVDLGGGLKVKGTIYTGASNPFKYHEAFHAVFRSLLSSKDQKRLLSIAKVELENKLGSNFNSELEKFKNSADRYKELSKQALLNEFYEEYMADEFQKFKKSPKSTKTNSAIKNFFNKILEWLRGFFGAYSPNALQNFFQEIDSGKFKSAPLANNQFTDSISKGVTVVANKIIRVRSVQSEDGQFGYQSLDPQIARRIISSMTARVLSMQTEDPNFNLEDAIEDTFVSYKILYNSMNDTYDNLNADLILTIGDIEEAFEDFGNDIKNALKENLRFFDFKIENLEDEQESLEDEFGPRGLRDTNQFDKDATSIGGFSSLSQFLRKYMGMTTLAEADQFGNVYLEKPEYDEKGNLIKEGEKLLVAANYSSIYEGTLKAVKNISDPIQILQRLYYFGLSNPETGAFVNKLFDDLGITWEGQLENGVLPEYTEEVKTPESELEKELVEKLQITQQTGGVKKPLLFQAVLKGFENFRVDYLFTHTTPEGRVITYTASNRDDIRSQIDRWGQAYMTKIQSLALSNKEIVNVLEKLERRLSTNKPIKSITNKQLVEYSDSVRDALYKYLGISLSSTYIQYSLLTNTTDLKTKYQRGLISSYKNEKALTFNDVNEIKVAVQDNRDLFSDGNEGVKSRLKQIGIGNAAFDENVGTSVFKNPNGDFVYAHQLPTFHLKKIAALNDTANGGAIIEKLKEGDLEDNFLLNNPAFKALSSEGSITVIRSAGAKKGNIEVTDEDLLSESTGKTPSEGKTYGDFTPKEFIVNLINSYAGMVNPKDGSVDTVEWFNEEGDVSKSALAVNLIRVIEASNTGDNLALPVIQAVKDSATGAAAISDEVIDFFITEIQKEFKRIQKESNPETATQELIDGYNALSIKNENIGTNEILGVEVGSESQDKVRAYKFVKNEHLLSPKGFNIEQDQTRVNLVTSDVKLNRIQNNEQQSLIYKESVAADIIGLTMPGIVKVASITDKSGNVVQKKITTRGKVSVTNTNRQDIFESLKGSISNTETDKFKKKVRVNNQVYYVETVAEAQFLKGITSMYVYDIYDIDVTDEEILQQTVDTTFNPEGYLNVLTEAARNLENTDLSFEEVLEKSGVSLDELKSYVRYRLNEDFLEFKNELDVSGAYAELGSFIRDGVLNSKGIQTYKTEESNNLLNLKVNNEDHNLMQIYFNDYVNTRAINEILLGDEALTLKDAVDKIKRAKAQNAAYYSAASYITAYQYGITKALQEFSLFSLSEPFVQKTHNPGTTDNADAQLWMTTKAARYFQFGFGKLTAAQAEMFDKIERGEELTSKDIEQHVKNKEMLNSMKLVYADGETFVKMSAFTLLPEFTSLKDENGNYTIPKPNRVPLHNLRVKLETFEKENDTVTVAAPQSALKMLKKNISNIHKLTANDSPLTADQSVTLNANFLGLQVINPSNKTTITDPTQVKNIVTSEQDDNVEVFINGKKTTIGKVRAAYNQAVKARGDISYLSKRNLVFDLDYAMDQLHKSMDQGKITVDLYTYLRYAEASLASTNSSSHLMELFSLNENGEQKYNLNNPLTYDKYVSLFMSYFSKGVFSEKTPGITAALASDYGVRIYRRVISVDENGMPDKHEVIPERMFHAMKNKPEIVFNIDEGSYPGNDQNLVGLADVVKKGSVVIIDRLRHNLKEYDKNGKYTGQRYGEMLLPAHHSEVIDKAERQNKGVPEAISKTFAVRIPSQDNHSTYNAKWVDFMPAIYGSTAIFAREIIEISGADFDIDKVFMQIKEFYTKNNEFYQYGNKKNEKENYLDYIRYVNNNVTNRDSIYAEALYKYKGRGLRKDRSLTNAEIVELRKDGVSQDSINALSVLFLPRTFKEYKAYKKKFKHEPYSGALNNDILDYKYALMGNDHVTTKKSETAPAISYEAADIEVLTDLWDELKVLLPDWAALSKEEGIDVDNLLGKLKMYGNNKEGARSIGAVVLPNLYLNLLQEYNVKLESYVLNGVETLPKIEFNGIKYDDFGETYEIKENGQQGQRAQYIISALITAATDNAKERLLAKLGLNINALSIVANLTALGVPIKTSVLFVNNPVIRDAFNKQINSPVSEPVYATALVEDRLDNLKAVFGIEDFVSIQDQDLINEIEFNPIPANVTIEELTKGEYSYDDAIKQASILKLFLNANQISKTTSLIGDLLTLTNGLGRDIEAIQKRKNAIEKLGIYLSDTAFENMPNKPLIDVRKIFTGKTWQAGYLNRFNEVTDSLMPKAMLSFNPLFKDMVYNIINQTKIKFLKRDRREKAINKISKDFLSYLTIKGYMYNRQQNDSQSIATLTNDLIYPDSPTESIIDIVTRLREITKNEENYFLNSFIILENADKNGNKTGINLAASNTFLKYNDSQKVSIQNGFMRLYQDASTRKDAVSLVHYMMVKDALQYNYKTIVEAVAPIALDGYLNYIDTVQEAFNRQSDTLFESTFGLKIDDLIIDFTQNYLLSAENAYLVPEVKPAITKRDVSPVYLDSSNGINTIKIDLYDKINDVVKTNEQTAERNVLSRQAASKNKVISANRKFIGSAFYGSIAQDNSDIYTDVVKNRVPYTELMLPLVVRRVIEKDDQKYYSYFILNRLQSVNPSETLINPFSKKAIGSYAEYVEMDLKGSSAQNGIGFLFGDRPNASSVKDYVNEVNTEQITGGENIKPVENNLSQEPGTVIPEGANVEATEKGIEVNGQNISLMESLKEGIPVGETTDFRGGIPTEEEPSALEAALREGIPVGEVPEETTEESGLMADLRKGIPIGDNIIDNYDDKAPAEPEDVNDSNLIPEDEMLIELLNWWDQNIEDPANVDSAANKENLKQKLNITSYDVFKYEFYFSEYTDISEYLEHIENCYL